MTHITNYVHSNDTEVVLLVREANVTLEKKKSCYLSLVENGSYFIKGCQVKFVFHFYNIVKLISKVIGQSVQLTGLLVGQIVVILVNMVVMGENAKHTSTGWAWACFPLNISFPIPSFPYKPCAWLWMSFYLAITIPSLYFLFTVWAQTNLFYSHGRQKRKYNDDNRIFSLKIKASCYIRLLQCAFDSLTVEFQFKSAYHFKIQHSKVFLFLKFIWINSTR